MRPYISVHLAEPMNVDVSWLLRRPQGEPMSRRTFCRMLAGFLVAAPRMAIAQGPTVVRRIGVLGAGEPQTPEQMQADRDALREFGWVEGQNLLVERRYANNRFEALQTLAEELARAKVEVRDKLNRAGYWERIGATNFHPSVRSGVQSGLNERAGSSEGRPEESSSEDKSD